MLTRLDRARSLVASAGVPILAISTAAIASLVLGVAFIIGASTASDMESRAATATAQARDVAVQSAALLQALTDAETAQRGYLLTGERRYLRPYDGAGERARTALGALAREGSERVEDIDRLTELTERRLQIIETTLALARSGRRDEALAILDDGAVVMAELRTRVDGLRERAAGRERTVRAEQRRLNKQGGLLQVGLGVLMVVALLIAATSLIFERITARRAAAVQARLTEELVAARNSAQDANDAKSRFLATASHDMRQPLHAMALYISTLERRVESVQAREILRNMDGAVRTMTRLFAALLDLARLEAGALKPEPTNFALGPLLQDVADYSVDPRAGACVRVVDPNVEVHSDPDLLEVILRNLTTNAVKHSKGAVLLGCRRVGDQVRIEVHDNGQGIPEDQIQRLFSEFVRGKQAGSADGIGLGLAIVERMAKLLGHSLSVKTEVGRGSVFAVTVPRAQSQMGQAPTPSAAEEADSLEGVRILVADDEPLALDAMRHAFEDAGARVTTARSGAQIRGLVAAESFDLHVFDLNLGQDDGLELLAEIERSKGAPPAALIVTGATTPDILARLRDSGRAWITKPITARTLLTAASGALRP